MMEVNYSLNYFLLYYIGFFCLVLTSVQSTHLQGTWKTSEFFKFLSKFGFQKTDLHHGKETEGYIFGNITTRANSSYYVTLAVLNRGYFLEYYGNRSIFDKDEACKNMFNRLSSVAFDHSCYNDGYDFLRKVPCPKGGLCEDEDTPENVVRSSQFTFHIRDLSKPRYVSPVSPGDNCTIKYVYFCVLKIYIYVL